MDPSEGRNEKQKAEILCKKLKLPENSWQLGKTKVFLKQVFFFIYFNYKIYLFKL
jgi:hypothetical protein